MIQDYEILYHGTTSDRLESIKDDGVLPTFNKTIRLTGAWATTILEKSINHARKRGNQRGGIEPVVLGYLLSSKWIRENNDKKAVNSRRYDENVYCFRRKISPDDLLEIIYPDRESFDNSKHNKI